MCVCGVWCPHVSGYRPILDAAKTFATDTQGCCGGRGGSGCCMSAAKESADGKAAEDVAPTGFYRVVSTTTSKLASDFLAKVCVGVAVWLWLCTSRLVDDTCGGCGRPFGPHSSLVWWQTYDGDAELVFPSYLQVRHKVEPLQLVGKKVTWYRPTTVDQLVAIRRRHPDVRERVGSVVCVCEDGRRAEVPGAHVCGVSAGCSCSRRSSAVPRKSASRPASRAPSTPCACTLGSWRLCVPSTCTSPVPPTHPTHVAA